MSIANVNAAQLQTASKAAGKGIVHTGEIDQSVFSLRDTLSNITVREANFSEFLSALKQSGLHTARQ